MPAELRPTSTIMTRKIAITAVDGHTGFTLAELLLTDPNLFEKFESVTGLSLHPNAPNCKELKELGAHIVPHKPGRVRDMVGLLKEIGADAICLIPPAHKEKHDVTVELIEATKKANIPNILFLSSVGCDLADKEKQPRLREFIDLETMVLSTKGKTSTETGHSPVVVRAGFYAENLLLYAPQAKEDGILPLPIGADHKFAPVALGDIAQVMAHVLTGRGKHGFSDKHRGQLIIMTGPMLTTGDELATAASQAIGSDLKFEDISQAEAKKVLRSQSESDSSELQYLLEYYSLVREGKTNYISTMAFHDLTGSHPLEPAEFFKAYVDEFVPERSNKRRKVHTK